jgi:hypothetical protein
MNAKKLMLIALATAGTLATSMVQARDVDVQWSVTIGGGLPVPVLRPVYVPVPPQVVVAVPQPVYVPVIERPYPVYGRPVPHRTHWDVDGDGIPNRYDRVYNPHWDRDGDGIPNRYDRVYNPPWDRDGDGVPNRHDRHDDRRDRWHHGGQGTAPVGGHGGWSHERQIRSVTR